MLSWQDTSEGKRFFMTWPVVCKGRIITGVTVYRLPYVCQDAVVVRPLRVCVPGGSMDAERMLKVLDEITEANQSEREHLDKIATALAEAYVGRVR